MGAFVFRVLIGLAGALTDAGQQYFANGITGIETDQAMLVGLVTTAAAYALGKLGRLVDRKYNEALDREVDL